MESNALLAEIILDHTSGAQELTRKTGQLLLRLVEEKKALPFKELREALFRLSTNLLRAKPMMASLFNLCDRAWQEVSQDRDRAAAATALQGVVQDFLEKMAENNRKIAACLFDLIEENSLIMTHSSSRSVREGLGACWEGGRRFSVICTESRPMCEGSSLARDLARQGLPTSLITDALSFSLLKELFQGRPRVSLVLVGADSVSVHGVTNKAGTLGLAMMAGQCSIPFYVLAGSEKFLPHAYPVEEGIKQTQSPEEILPSPPQGLKIINRYFDLTPLASVTALISEEGFFSPQDLKGRLERLQPQSELMTML